MIQMTVFSWVDAVKRDCESGRRKISPPHRQQVRTLVDPSIICGAGGLAFECYTEPPVFPQLLDISKAISGGIRVSANLPAPASRYRHGFDIQDSADRELLLRYGKVCSLIRDPYTEAATGRVSLTAVALWNFQVVRSAAYNLSKFKLA